MKAKPQGCSLPLVLAVSLAVVVITLLLAAGQPSQGEEAQNLGPDCSMLDNTEIRGRMSGAFELSLLMSCGRLEPGGPVAPVREPVPAAMPAVGPDTRVNAVDPISQYTIQSETSIAVNPDSGTICTTYNDLFHHSQGDGTSGYSRSVDGGLTWQDGGPMPAGAGGVSRGDPSVAWRRADGHFYYASLHTFGLGLHRSVDDCASFEWVAMIHAGDSDDKEFLSIDNNPDSHHYGRFYVGWTLLGEGSIQFVYSDDGMTWSEPIVLSYGVAFGAWPAVAPNGDVFVAWVRWSGYPYGSIHEEIARSTDGGDTFSLVTPPLSGATMPRNAAASAACGRPALNGFIRYFPMPQIVTGPDGCLHVVYSYDPDGYDVGDVVDVYYRRSCDSGTTWEPEVQLNDDGGLTDQFYPALTVTEDNVVAASWYDRRHDSAENYLFDRYWTASYDGGISWESNARVSDISSPVYIPPWSTSCYHGDYDQMASHGQSVYLLWSDDRVFFNGHYDPDIWFDKASVAPDFALDLEPDSLDVCLPDTAAATVHVGSINGYDQPVTLGDSDVPIGVETTFQPNPVPVLPGSSTYSLTVGPDADEGWHTWPISGSSPSATHDVAITMIVNGAVPPVPAPVAPPDGAQGVRVRDIVLQWSAVPAATSYRLQVDDDPAFSSPEADVTGIGDNSFTLDGPLSPATTYHWRVSAANGCGEGEFSEPFSFTTSFPCILLVDDDDDDPDVQAYYGAALDGLGYGYDVFDVGGGAGDGPPLESMQEYPMVFWFSGDKWSTTGAAGPNACDEAALAAYLEGGGRLFLSSQSYLYDFGLTPFGETFLGVGSFTPGTGDATVKIGLPGDPIGDELGPYELTYPANMLDHGDTVNPDPTASLAFQGQNGHPLDIDKQTGPWQTVFFGTSWVPVAYHDQDNGREVLGRIVDWFGGCAAPPSIVVEPLSLEATVMTGNRITHTLWLTNEGGSELAFSIQEMTRTVVLPQVDLPWVSENPANGVIAPGGGQPVDVVFDAHGLEPALYLGLLDVESDDPVRPHVGVSLTLTVVPSSESHWIYLPLILRH